MNKRKLLILVLCLSLVQITVGKATDVRTFHINPIKKVSPIETNIKELFAQQFNILAFALGIYTMDTKERLSKDAIKASLADNSRICKDILGLVFDLDNIDFKRKGFTRHYPFSVNGKDFIIRIFDVREKHYLSNVEVFYEGVFETDNLGFQIIPGLKTILQETKVEKIPIYDPAAYTSQP